MKRRTLVFNIVCKVTSVLVAVLAVVHARHVGRSKCFSAREKFLEKSQPIPNFGVSGSQPISDLGSNVLLRSTYMPMQ